MAELLQAEQIEQVILLIRGQRVMLDRDLAALYGVQTKNLNKAVQRNVERFPADFMFRLTLDEAQACAASRFQFGTLKRGQHFKFRTWRTTSFSTSRQGKPACVMASAEARIRH